MEPTTAAGRPGTLENPEVREDVPGHIIPIIEREFDDFDTESQRFLRGDVEETEFIKFRLKQGVYGQRQPAVQMIRVKLPFGGITPEQIDAFADVIEKYVPLRKGHITTRQNIQLHHVPLPDAAAAIRELAEANLSSREGCGNTVRNVTGDPWAGVCEDEVFDLTPYAGAYVRYFVRHPTTQMMPRKIKTAFDGAPGADRSLTGIHDIAFLARERDGVRGVEVRVGGGTSIMPRIAPTLYEFVGLDDGEYLKVAEACLRIFDRQDFLRVNRARARIKVLVDKVGMDKFREMVDEELQGDWVAERHFDVAGLRFDVDEEALAPAPPQGYASRAPNGTHAVGASTNGRGRLVGDGAAFERFCDDNVLGQRQHGFSAIHVKVTRGDLTPAQLRGIAEIMRRYSGGFMRTTVHQNFVLRWVRDETVYEVWRALDELGLAETGPDTITDVVSCPGTDSCKLGITSSMGLNAALQQRLEEMRISDPLTRALHIKMSGCPNGCSQHHIANIGFYGASIKVGGHTIPAYVAHVAGNFEGGEIVYGQRLKVRLPAKRVPDAVERWLRWYEAERQADEPFNAFTARVGTKAFEDKVRDLAMPVEFGVETMNTFIDWNRDVPFKVVRGEGECAV